MNPFPGYQTNQTPGGPLDADERLRQDLHATLAARQELGPNYERELINSFLQHLDQSIDARIAQQILQRPRRAAADHDPTKRLAVSLALAIPLIAIAGGIAGGGAIFGILVLIGFLNVYYDRWSH